MFNHWHIEAPEDHLLREWLSAALAEEHRGWAAAGEDLLSWPATGGETAWLRFPDGRKGRSTSIASLRKDFIRFSPHFYNSADDIRRGLAAIRAAL